MEFKYKAKGGNGDMLEGVIEAPDEDAAVNILHSRGYTILSLNKINTDIFSVDIDRVFNRPGNKDVVVFARQLATLVDADMPLLESLRTLTQQTEKASFREILDMVSKYVEGGSTLSQALGHFPNLFSDFYVNLVKSGESSGKLHDSLIYLAGYLEKSRELNSKIKSALSYPVFVICSLVLVAFIMAVWVLPNLLTIFEEVGVTDLPITTRALIFITKFVNKFFYLIVFGAIGILGYAFYYLKTPKGKAWFDNFKINAPLFGPIAKNFYLSRASESMATLTKAGLPIIDSLNITASIMGNSNYESVIFRAKDLIKQGELISDAFKGRSEIPPLFSSMIAIGERTGKLSAMLEHLAKYYKSESENTIQGISQLLEPILVLILGLGVAILVASILLPMYNLVGAI